MDEKISLLLAFVLGILIGRNWPKIEEFLRPHVKTAEEKSSGAYSSFITFFAQQKEKVDDMMAEWEIKRKAAEEGITVEKEPQPQDLARQVIIKHPEGISLRKIGEELGVHPVRFARAVKELLDKNEIRKEGELYFPVG